MPPVSLDKNYLPFGLCIRLSVLPVQSCHEYLLLKVLNRAHLVLLALVASLM
jgi:hypothetical protein